MSTFTLETALINLLRSGQILTPSQAAAQISGARAFDVLTVLRRLAREKMLTSEFGIDSVERYRWNKTEVAGHSDDVLVAARTSHRAAAHKYARSKKGTPAHSQACVELERAALVLALAAAQFGLGL